MDNEADVVDVAEQVAIKLIGAYCGGWREYTDGVDDTRFYCIRAFGHAGLCRFLAKGLNGESGQKFEALAHAGRQERINNGEKGHVVRSSHPAKEHLAR